MIRTEDVLLFEAGDKYVNVHVEGRVLLIRRSLRELLPDLDPTLFAQVHRRVIVNVAKVRSASRAGNGRLLLELDGTDHRPPCEPCVRPPVQGHVAAPPKRARTR